MIDVDRVTAVLLADGWHEVENKSFVIGSYRFGELIGTDDQLNYEDVTTPDRNCASWSEEDEWGCRDVVSCPLTSILAVRENRK